MTGTNSRRIRPAGSPSTAAACDVEDDEILAESLATWRWPEDHETTVWHRWAWLLIGGPVSVAMFFWVKYASHLFFHIAVRLPSWSGTALWLGILVALGFYLDHLFPMDPEEYDG